MTYLIDSHNTIGAGSVMVTKNFIRGLLRHDVTDGFQIVIPDIKAFWEFKTANTANIHFVFVPQFSGIIQILARFLYSFMVFPFYVLYLNPKCIFVLGNYSPVPWARKVVMMHTPYLVDDGLFEKASVRTKIEEGIVRLLFRITLLSTKTVIVQNERMKALFRDKYGDARDVIVLPTPVSDIMGKRGNGPSVSASSSEKRILYVSRYYPHKNHAFPIELVRNHAGRLRERKVVFYLTLDPRLGRDVEKILSDIVEQGLGDIIVNLGEISNEELVSHYLNATALFFPSKSESFGLPLVEAMAWGLPVIVPDLAYAREVCGDAGIYYREGDIGEAFSHLESICVSDEHRQEFSEKSLDRFKIFPTTEQWAGEILSLLGDERLSG